MKKLVRETGAVFHKDCNRFNVYFLFQFQNLTEIISAVIISKYRCIKPHEINLSCNNYNRPNLKLEHKFVVCTHAQYLFCLKQQLQLNDFLSEEPTETCDKNVEYLECPLPL